MIIIAGLINYLLFFSAGAVFCSLFLHRKPEWYLLPWWVLNSLCWYVFAAFEKTDLGFSIIYWTNMLLYVPIYFKARRLKRQIAAARIFTPGFLFWMTASAVLMAVAFDESFADWDSVSHWGKCVKLLAEDGILNCRFTKGELLHASYPPGMALMTGLVLKCFPGDFSEGITIFAFQSVNLAMLICLFYLVKWKQRVQWALWALAAAAMLAWWHGRLCYADMPMALMAGTAFFLVMTVDFREKSGFFVCGLLTAFLFMIRNAGWGYSILLTGCTVVKLWADRRYIFSGPASRRWAMGGVAASVLLLPAAVKASWEMLLKLCGTPIRFTSGAMAWDEILSAFSPGGGGWTALGELGGRAWWFLIFAILLMAAAAAAGYVIKDRVILNQVRIAAWIWGAGGIIYFMMLVFLHLTEYSDTSIYPSLNRYLLTFTITPFFIFMLIFSNWMRRNKHFRFRNALHALLFWAVWSILILLITAAGDRRLRLHGNYAQWRSECDRIKRYSALLDNDITFTAISTTGYSYKHFYFSYLYPYSYAGIEWKPGEYEFETDTDAKTAAEGLKDFDYVYIDDLASAAALYPSLFTAAALPGTLCTKDDRGRWSAVSAEDL